MVIVFFVCFNMKFMERLGECSKISYYVCKKFRIFVLIMCFNFLVCFRNVRGFM